MNATNHQSKPPEARGAVVNRFPLNGVLAGCVLTTTHRQEVDSNVKASN